MILEYKSDVKLVLRRTHVADMKHRLEWTRPELEIPSGGGYVLLEV